MPGRPAPVKAARRGRAKAGLTGAGGRLSSAVRPDLVAPTVPGPVTVTRTQTPSSLGRAWFRLLTGLLLLAAVGCSYGISVRRANGPHLFDAWRANVIAAGELSQRTLQTLRRWDLDRLYYKQPTEAYGQLQTAAAREPDPEVLFALAEMSYLLGQDAEKHESSAAVGYYYLCAGYAYHYLFPHRPEPDPAPVARAAEPDEPGPFPLACGQGRFDSFAFDPRFRLACDLYNTGLAKFIRAAQRHGRLDSRQQLHLPAPDGPGFTLSVVHHGFPWQPEEFGPLLFCADFEVVGLANHYRGYGLGVALIGTRTAEARDRLPGHGPAAAGRYPHEVSFPVSAFLHFHGSVAELGSRQSGRLELYNPLAAQTVRVAGRGVPLETDLTTPLAYFLSRTDLDGVEYAGFLQADKIRHRAGMYMFEPYQPGKIPVVMVHGLLSTPLTWTTMFNDLRADPQLRSRYQFWFYLYPTGQSYLATAADLRRELARLRAELDPRGQDPALDHLVMVGHSMGGLVSRLLTADSGDDFWQLASARPFDSLRVSEATREELQRLFFFARQPNVERVVFLATPHRGSALSPSLPARLAARFIKLPRRLTWASVDLAREEPGAWPPLSDGQLANSLDLLAPGSPALELLAARPKPPSVHFHSILGEALGHGEAGSDGVVPYTSAHLDAAESEVIVPANHLTVHHHPRAVLEVQRILLDHLRQVQARDGIQPAGATGPCPPPGSIERLLPVLLGHGPVVF